MKKKQYIYGLILGFTLTAMTACSPEKEEQTITPPQDQESSVDENNTNNTDKNQTSDTNQGQTSDVEVNILDEFHSLLSENSSIKEIAAFINKNISDATKEEVSEMVFRLEELHTIQREEEEEKYSVKTVQEGFNAIESAGIDSNQVDSIKDEGIKELVKESKENGYKIETVDGYYFPVIDYSFYKQFSSYATPEVKDYINIMTVESDSVFSKGANLMIGWDEVVSRIISIEKFLDQYPESNKEDYLQLLYDNYVYIALHGLDNTPLFDYESKKMNEDALKAYIAALTQHMDSKFLKLLSEFMEFVEKNNDTLTEEVESFRTSIKNRSLYENTETSKDPNRYEVAGIDDADEFDETYELLRTALLENDKDTFADYIAYPINATIDGKKTEIKNKEEFIRTFDNIMNEDMKGAFLNQKLENFFVNYQGIMVGNGQFWFNQLEGTAHKFSIYAINN